MRAIVLSSSPSAWLAVVLASQCLVTQILQAEEFDFPYPANRLGWADGAGKLSVWVNGNWEVDLGGGEQLPLRFQFSSMQNRVADGMLGVGWWVPLLESSVVQLDERKVRVTTLGGQSVYLTKVDAEKEEVYQTKSQAWTGRLRSRDRFHLEGPGGWEYEYRQGKIVGAVTPKGKKVTWSYGQDGHAQAIEAEGIGEVLSLRIGGPGLAEEISVNGQPAFRFGYGRYPQVSLAEGFVAVAGIEPSVSRIAEVLGDGEVGREFVSEVEVDGEGVYEMRYSATEGEKTRVAEVFSWEAVEGLLRSDAESAYEKAPLPEAPQGSSFKYVREFEDGTTESYLWDSGRYTETRKSRRGRIVTRSFVATPGSAFMKVQRSSLLTKDGNVPARTVRHYDLEGSVIRSVVTKADCKIVNRFRKGGMPAIKSSNGKVLDFGNGLKVVYSKDLDDLLWIKVRDEVGSFIDAPKIVTEVAGKGASLSRSAITREDR